MIGLSRRWITPVKYWPKCWRASSTMLGATCATRLGDLRVHLSLPGECGPPPRRKEPGRRHPHPGNRARDLAQIVRKTCPRSSPGNFQRRRTRRPASTDRPARPAAVVRGILHRSLRAVFLFTDEGAILRLMATIPQAFTTAIQHHQGGRLQAAEQIYRQILAVEPKQPDALHLLGVIAHQTGKHEAAVEYIGRAIRLQGSAAAFHNNLGEVYRAMGRIPEAIVCYCRAVELKPDYAEAHGNLGLALKNQGKVDEAVASYRRARKLRPDFAEVHNNLGLALKDLGKAEEAVDMLPPGTGIEARLCRGTQQPGPCLEGPGEDGRSDRLLAPDSGTEAGPCRGTQQPGQCVEGSRRTGRSGRLLPPGTATEAGLCRGTQQPGQCFQGPREAGGSGHLLPPGTGTEAGLRPGTQQPADGTALLPGCDAGSVGRDPSRLRSAARGGAAASSERTEVHSTDSRARRLRLGFVSPDLGKHPVGYFLVRVLENLSPRATEQCETICYSDRIVKDGMTQRLQAATSEWRDVYGMSDQGLAEQIRRIGSTSSSTSRDTRPTTAYWSLPANRPRSRSRGSATCIPPGLRRWTTCWPTAMKFPSRPTLLSRAELANARRSHLL